MLLNSILSIYLSALALAIKAAAIAGTEVSSLIARAGTSDDHPRIKFSWESKVTFTYNCPVGGTDTRALRVKVNFDGSRTTLTNVGNAETLVVRHVEGLTPTSYRVNSFVGHGMCLAKAGFRYCEYAMSATLSADADETSRTARFSVPGQAGQYNVIPSVTEGCTPFNSHTRDCKTITARGACRIINVHADAA